MPVFDSRTLCDLNGLRYDFNKRSGDLVMGERSCTDMVGCIRLFTGIDPEVVSIQTWRSGPEGETRDTAYHRTEEDWIAVLPPHMRRS